jgi:transcriptional regulator of acetoin/glycerol metabolism
MAVSDASGQLLWVEGHRVARTARERMNFVEGAWWDEEHAGTNAPGTALALALDVQIFATEHFRLVRNAVPFATGRMPPQPWTGSISGPVWASGARPASTCAP